MHKHYFYLFHARAILSTRASVVVLNVDVCVSHSSVCSTTPESRNRFISCSAMYPQVNRLRCFFKKKIKVKV